VRWMTWRAISARPYSLENFPALPKLRKLWLSDNRIAGGLEALMELDNLAGPYSAVQHPDLPAFGPTDRGPSFVPPSLIVFESRALLRRPSSSTK